ncbi:MAG: glycosyltransferase [Gammaproteobacteria bacterium]|nr:glycosyltransferase [Gammaproteobacteria bacterium]
MKQRSIPSHQLIFTVAIKDEIPVDWLKERNVAVHLLKAIKAGILKNSPLSEKNSGVLFVITGVGSKHSTDAAIWIKTHLQPLYVINIGSCGAIGNSAAMGTWITPVAIENSEEGQTQPIDTRLPFSFPKNLPYKPRGRLLTVKKPEFGKIPDSWKTCHYVDMEAFHQAQIFADSEISFHLLKMISDESNYETIELFQRMLFVMRKQLKTILSFLDMPIEPDITVVIPTYNRQDRITHAIESVLAQTLLPQEIIVVDDGSSDSTHEVLKKYSDKIRLISLNKNHGVSYARNKAITLNQSSWIALLDSDDLWSPDKLEKQWQFLQANPFYQIMQSQEIWIRNSKRVNACKHHKKPQGWIWKESLERCMISPSSTLIKRNLFDLYGTFDENLPACEDYDLWLLITRHHVVGLESSLSLTRFGGHKDQLSSQYPAMDRFRISALIKALDAEQEPYYRQALLKVLIKKLPILINGYQKRDNQIMSQKYQTILSSLNNNH